MAENIHPIFESILKKGDKESLLHQRGIVIWLIGLSGSGKSTIARALENKLHHEKVLTQILDGDNLRSGLNHDLEFSDEERVENRSVEHKIPITFKIESTAYIAAFI